MRPLAVLLGIVMGSTVSISLGLALTLIVFALLPEYSDRIAEEYGPLWRSFVAMAMVSGLAVAGFVGELRQRTWRHYAQVALLLVLAGGLWLLWPRNSM